MRVFSPNSRNGNLNSFSHSFCPFLSRTPQVTSKYSGNAVRTTHLTGASTDMGIALGHILKGRHEEWWKVQMHGIAVVGFFIGGVLGFFAFEVRN